MDALLTRHVMPAQGAAKLDMDALAILDVSTALPASSLSVVGDLVLHQREALRVTNGYASHSHLWAPRKLNPCDVV